RGEETDQDEKGSDYGDYVPSKQQQQTTDEDLGLVRKKKPHGGCGHKQPTIRKEGLKLYVNYKSSKDSDEQSQDTRKPLTPADVHQILKKISPQDLKDMADILKANQNVKRYETEGHPAHVVNEFEALLQFHCATYMDNEMA
ncbi:17042_t:CDS:2, partial [Dentiscutata heterogama]